MIGSAVIPTVIANAFYLPRHLLPRMKPRSRTNAASDGDAAGRAQRRNDREATMFGKILHANDGSEHAFHALALAIAIAQQNNSELHMVSVEEIDYMPEFIEEVREETGTAARRFHGVVQRARAMAEEQPGELRTHVLPDIRCATSSNWRPSSRRNCW